MTNTTIQVEVQVLQTCVLKEKGGARQRIMGDRVWLDLPQALRLAEAGVVNILTPRADYTHPDPDDAVGKPPLTPIVQDLHAADAESVVAEAAANTETVADVPTTSPDTEGTPDDVEPTSAKGKSKNKGSTKKG